MSDSYNHVRIGASSVHLLYLLWSDLPFYRLEKNFSEGIVFSRVCDFVLFIYLFFFLSVYTITLKGSTNPNQIFTEDF